MRKIISVVLKPRMPVSLLKQGTRSIFLANNLKGYFSTNEEKKDVKVDAQDSHDDFKPKVKPAPEYESFYPEIEKTLKENKVVLFMKGVPQHPQCGYSNFVVEVLKYYKISDYKAVDILKNPGLREAVKKYSKWPTYPQLYIDGELLGGCDIVNEMHKEGTLKKHFAEHDLIPKQ